MRFITYFLFIAAVAASSFASWEASKYFERQHAQKQAIAYGCGSINPKTLSFEWIDRNYSSLFPADIFSEQSEKEKTKKSGSGK